SAIWYFVFKYLIEKMDLKTPGRETDEEETKLYSKKEYLDMKDGNGKKLNKNAIKATLFLELLGGKENIEDVTNCATRLRLTVKDTSKIAPLGDFKKAGAHGLVSNGKAIQVIVGLSVPSVREEFENLLAV
ncbi:MAG: system alpha-glucoside-specific transporter subunit, partial [Chlamydiales bacterium]|nr:system alpha-glucoside-specific transporter subunit [Chlamydiales bacterium]